MKKCIICGNLGDENSTTCEMCGGQFQEVPEETSGVEENVSCTEQEQDHKAMKQTEQQPQEPARRPRRPAGPQIYGQNEGMPNAQTAYGQQGTIRREVPARSASAGQARPAAQPMSTQGQPQRRPAAQPMNAQGQPQRRPAAQPMNAQGQLQRRPAAQPMNAQGQPQRRPAAQPMSTQGHPAAQSMNAQGQPQGRSAAQSMNGQGQPQGRPAAQSMNGQGQPQGRPAAQSMNGQGQPQGRSAAQSMNVQGQPMRQPGVPMNMQSHPNGNGSAVHPGRRMETARAMLKSPLLILIALLNTACLGGAIAAIFMHQMNYSQMIRLISDINMPAQLAGYVDTVTKLLSRLDAGMIPVNLALHIPDLFLCLGLWLICITVRTADEKMSGIGFLCMKVYVVINMIVTCVVVLAGLIVSVTLVVAAWVSSTNSMVVIAAVILVAMIITALASIMYYFCYLATIKVCRLNAGTGEPYGQVSAYVALIHVLIGLTGIVGLLSGIVNSEISNIVGSVGKIGWMILFAVWIMNYKKKMSVFED